MTDITDSYRYKLLELMGRYVKDNYLMHDLVKEKRTSCYLAKDVNSDIPNRYLHIRELNQLSININTSGSNSRLSVRTYCSHSLF
jgi:hypothetical protein